MVGRLSVLPDVLNDKLFLKCLPTPHALYLTGVKQSTTSVANAGFAFSIADALLIPEISQEDLSMITTFAPDVSLIFKHMAEAVLSMTAYYTLGRGAAIAFNSKEELADTIISSFVDETATLTPFSSGGKADTVWPRILEDLLRICYGIEVVKIIDIDGKISCELSTDAKKNIIDHSARFIIVYQQRIGTYPVYIINARKYFRALTQFRWLLQGRIYSKDNLGAKIYDTIYEMITPAKDVELNYNLMIKIFGKDEIIRKYVNFHNQCYGVLLKNRVFIPIKYSPVVYDKIDVFFEPYNEDVLSISKTDVMKTIDVINKHFPKNKKITDEIKLIKGDQIIGFSFDKLYFFHKPQPFAAGGEYIRTPYYPWEINKYINKYHGRDVKIDANPYYNFSYQLFILEFVNIIRNERNDEIRKNIYNSLNVTNFLKQRDVSIFRRKIATILEQHATDKQTIFSAMKKTRISHLGSRKALEATVKNISFDFDKTTLIELRKRKNKEEVIEVLRKLMSSRIEFTDEDVSMENIYTACTTDLAHCRDGKMMLSRAKFDKYIDLLASDILNPFKYDLLTLYTFGIVDEEEFITRPDEYVIRLK
jgi:hypothetical protein